MDEKYRVIHLKDNVYQVWQQVYRSAEYELTGDAEYDCVFQGSLADCEAWIRLKESGYL